MQALIESNFFWDSSISTKTTDKPIWPYTLDYAIPHECKIKSCPTKAFPGVWEIPVNLHYVSGLAGGQCSYLDQCVFALLGSDDVFDWLKEDFERHYNVSIVFLRLCNTIFFARLYYTEYYLVRREPFGLFRNASCQVASRCVSKKHFCNRKEKSLVFMHDTPAYYSVITTAVMPL